LYGTTYGSNSSFGTVFKISTNGGFATLHTFAGGIDITNGTNPQAGLVLGRDGIFYGSTCYGGNGYGTIFSITADGLFSHLYSFTNRSGDGGYPYTAMVQGVDGNLYGSTSGGSTYNGAVFKLTTQGVLAGLYRGIVGTPSTRLLQAADGSFYGITSDLSTPSGRIYKITTNGILTTVFSFYNNDGYHLSELVQGRDGSFYCTSQYGGAGYGAVLRITIAPVFKAVTLTNSTLTLTWSTEVGSTYQLQYKSDVNSGDWVNLGGPILATGSTLSATDSVANDPQRFYRVAVLPQ
jgi:uncharacterized repeat protein (TIGR03803 family)